MFLSRISILFLMILVLHGEQGLSQEVQLKSPDGKISVSLRPGTRTGSLVSYSLFESSEKIFEKAVIGFEMEGMDQPLFYIPKPERKSYHGSWQPVYGERKIISENYNQVAIRFRSRAVKDLQIITVCRAYNEGFAFQYEIVWKKHSITIQEEQSTFPVSPAVPAWVSSTAQGILQQKTIGEIKGLVERPVTIKLNEKKFLAIGEASLVNYARMKFRSFEEQGLVTQLDGPVIAENKLVSPWRYVLTAASPGGLLEKNDLLLNLNRPNQIKDVSWIRPGKIIREATLTTEGAFTCIDYAARHQIRYICFDAGWYGKEDSDSSDATRVSIDPPRYRGPLDLKKVIAYGNQKNIGVILYVNRHALERQLDTLLPLYQSWGVKGIKFGFVQVGSQQWTSWLHEAIRKAAKFKLLVDVHDEYRPTGYTRTYPNLLTQEGIRGDEESPYTEHSITSLFTRMIAGSADNTICYFTSRVNKMSSHAAQMAKSVCIYSPLQFLYWYDRPVADSVTVFREGEIRLVDETAWFDSLPVVWDETRVIESDMEAYATIARKKDQQWFLGSLNGAKARSVQLSFSFLDKNKKYKAIIYTDDPTMNSVTQVKKITRDIDCNAILTFEIAARNGLAIQIVPVP